MRELGSLGWTDGGKADAIAISRRADRRDDPSSPGPCPDAQGAARRRITTTSRACRSRDFHYGSPRGSVIQIWTRETRSITAGASSGRRTLSSLVSSTRWSSSSPRHHQRRHRAGARPCATLASMWERRLQARAAREAMAQSDCVPQSYALRRNQSGALMQELRGKRWPSAAHSRAISGPFEGHQRAIRGPSSMAKPIRRPSRGSLEGPCTHLLSRVRLMRYAIRRIQWQSAHLLGRVRLRIRYRLPPFLLHFGRDLEELLLGRHLMRDAIICTQTQSEFPLDAIKHRSPRSARARAKSACTGAARQYRLG